jgi:hypothetical protein
MKISEQDLLILAETYYVQSHDKTSSLLQFCEELIALAQEVEPLKFVDVRSHWVASSIFGYYKVVSSGFEYDVLYLEYVPDGVHVSKLCTIEGMDNAKEAAQQDYAKRVRSGLKYGGGE